MELLGGRVEEHMLGRSKGLRGLPATGGWVKWLLYLPPSGCSSGGGGAVLNSTVSLTHTDCFGRRWLSPSQGNPLLGGSTTVICLLSDPCLDTSSGKPSRLTLAVSSLLTWAHCVEGLQTHPVCPSGS